ncbi:fasciclin domain-containing protein [Palleronia sp. KMU-117]
MNGAKGVAADVAASNSVIHVINGVLLPQGCKYGLT